jgi:CDP-diacylglycerol---serine O-phosphatidyltransferase
MFLAKNIYATRIKAQLANMITLMNLSFGILSIILIFKGHGNLSATFIFLAAIFDRFDGMCARYFNSESDFGKELDSLCDLVSFGIAPALLIYGTALNETLWVGVLVTITYVLAGAIRLAKFNVREFDGNFYGVPITAAGVLASLSYFLYPHVSANTFIFILSILAYLMVSNIRIAKV